MRIIFKMSNLHTITEEDFHIHSKNVIYREVFNKLSIESRIESRIESPIEVNNINQSICFQLMDEIYAIFCNINRNRIAAPISYIKLNIKNIIYRFVIEHQHLDQFPYLFIIAYYLYIQIINYKKNDEIKQHCLDADMYIDSHNYKNTYISKIIYILLIFLPPHIYTDDIYIKIIQFYEFINLNN